MFSAQLPPGGARSPESVPFAFVAESDAFRSNVVPPPRERPDAGQIAGRILLGLTVTAGFVGALVLGMPALSSGPQTVHEHAPTAAHER